MTPDWKSILSDGLWTSNPGLVQLLGLCPLLAISNSVVNALGLGLATLFVLLVSNGLVSISRRWLLPSIRIPVYVLIIAGTVSMVELLLAAYRVQLYAALGIFIPLIVTNCAIIARAEIFASRQPLPAALLDALGHGLGFALVLLALGAVREIVGHGTLFRHADRLLGEGVEITLQVVPLDSGLLLALLPPGAFISLGLLVAIRNLITSRHAERVKATRPAAVQGTTPA